jgi:hypothetical protein
MTVNEAQASRKPLRPDDRFFLCMALVAAVAVLVGFARSYFLVGAVFAPLPSALVHVHAVVFLSWIVLFATQISLVATRHVSLHRRLGTSAIALAALMIPLGLLTASARVARQLAHPGPDSMADVLDLYADPVFDILMFSVFVTLAFQNRSRPPVHKRLMLFATFSLLDAGFDRWSIFDPYPLWEVNLVCFVPLVLAVMAYDYWSAGAIPPVTLWSTVFLLTTQQVRHLFSQTVLWSRFAHFVAAHMPAF